MESIQIINFIEETAGDEAQVATKQETLHLMVLLLYLLNKSQAQAGQPTIEKEGCCF